MGSTTEFANQLLANRICAVPCMMPSKRPALESWTKYQSILPIIGEHQFNGALGIITGKISGNLFVLDIDIKYDVTGTLLNRFQEAVGEDLWARMYQVAYIQRTVNKGLHIFLRCEQIEKNEKLARRYATPEELAQNPEEKIKVLLETRAEGGFIVCAPTEGYEVLEGSLTEIGFISAEDKEQLFEACRSLNEVFAEVKPPYSKTFNSQLSGLPPWDDYNQRADIPAFLLSHGWSYLKAVGENVHLTRPGKKGTTSGTYHAGLNLFRCFTTSSELDADKSYSPAALFTFLECNGDFTQAAKKLYDLGYGERGSIGRPKEQVRTSEQNKEPFTTSALKRIWQEVLITEQPPDEIPLIEINGVPVATAGNHSLIVGKKKSRKTLFIVWLISRCPEAMLFDTEQGKTHVWKAKDKIKRLSGLDVPTFYLRGKSPAERRAIIYGTLQNWPSRPKIIVIDGIRDLLSNINDPDQATDLIVWLERLTLEFGVHVINVLHLNKTDGNARGHIGSELLNKAQTTIELELDEQAGVTLVKCESSRDRPFENFAFTHGLDELPELCSMPIKGVVLTDDQKRTRLKHVFEGDVMKYSDLMEAMKAHFEVGQNKARNLLAEFTRAGWIIKSGAERSKNTVYKLMISVNTP